MSSVVRFAAVVVVYNAKCEESATCKRLLSSASENVSVFVFDNSTSDFGNREFCRKFGWNYLGGDGNYGISKAYNACLNEIKQKSKANIVCLFDDDTTVDPRYFEILSREAETHPNCDIFLPLIYCGDTLISPCRLSKSYRQLLFSSEADALSCETCDLSAINSCMAVRLSVYDDFTYDENVFLDGIDHHFMKYHLTEKKRKVCVFPCRCNHSFSGMERPNKEAAYQRFCIFAKDHAFWFRNEMRLYWLIVGKRAFRLSITYHSFSFLRAFFKFRKHF